MFAGAACCPACVTAPTANPVGSPARQEPSAADRACAWRRCGARFRPHRRDQGARDQRDRGGDRRRDQCRCGRGALYAAGFGAFELQNLAFELEKSAVTDWSLFERGWVRARRWSVSSTSGSAIARSNSSNADSARLPPIFSRAAWSPSRAGTPARQYVHLPRCRGIRAGADPRRGICRWRVSGPVPVRWRGRWGPIWSSRSISPRGRAASVARLARRPARCGAIMGNRIAGVETAEAEIVVRGLAVQGFGDELRGPPSRHPGGERAGFAAIAAIKQRIARAEGTA